MIIGNQDNFKEEVLEASTAVLVDFNATWCGPCQMMHPVMEELVEDGFKVVSVDVDEQEALAEQYEVSTIPCLIVFKNGQEVARTIGVTPKKKLIKM